MTALFNNEDMEDKEGDVQALAAMASASSVPTGYDGEGTDADKDAEDQDQDEDVRLHACWSCSLILFILVDATKMLSFSLCDCS